MNLSGSGHIQNQSLNHQGQMQPLSYVNATGQEGFQNSTGMNNTGTFQTSGVTSSTQVLDSGNQMLGASGPHALSAAQQTPQMQGGTNLNANHQQQQVQTNQMQNQQMGSQAQQNPFLNQSNSLNQQSNQAMSQDRINQGQSGAGANAMNNVSNDQCVNIRAVDVF